MISSIDYLHIPALDSPPGITANFINPPSIASSVLEVSLPLSIISTAFVALRIYTRWKIVRSLGWDDLSIGFGLILSWTFCALVIIETQHGLGVDLWNLYTASIIIFRKLDLAVRLMNHLALLCAKISILLTMFRMNTSPVASLTFRLAIITMVSFTTIYNLTAIAVTVFGCSPISVAPETNPNCANKTVYAYIYGGCNIFSSCAMLVLGMTVGLNKGLLGRGLGKAARWCLGIVVCAGCFVCVASIIRLIISVPYLHSKNFTRFKVYISRWCEIELTSTLILASLLTLYPFLTGTLPAYFSSNTVSPSPDIELESQVPSRAPSRTRKMSEATSTISLSTTSACTSMSRLTTRRDVSLEESEIALGGIAMEERIALGERRVLGGSVKKKGPVVKTVVYDVKYEA
ncbi:hypothetical protein VTL71DRAFT_5845 [Oculimacula yallundae]|uniref:Rhodopsin domain-containing protein n=1 Tax=Oculimacula yallundae TaxID=86028 RepID=A0ABR4BYP6_9HELO